jgi:hypothetical protein
MSAGLKVGIEAIEDRLTRGTLPREWPVVAGGEWGAGRSCALCETAIGTDEVEVRARYREPEPLDFHVQCFVGWWRVMSHTRWV